MNWTDLKQAHKEINPTVRRPARETDDEFLKKLQEENEELERQIRLKSGASLGEGKEERTPDSKSLESSASDKKQLSGKIIRNSFQEGSKRIVEQEISERDRIIGALAKEIEIFKSSKSPEKVGHLEGEIAMLEKKVEGLENETATLRDELQQKEEENNDLLKENEKIKAAFSKKRTKYKQLKLAAKK